MEKPLFRYLALDRSKLDADKRTIGLAFSSETPVSRSDDDNGDYEEILSHNPEDVDLTRMVNGAPLLVNHNTDDQVGVVESALIGTDRVGRAIVRFGTSARAQEIYDDVKNGIRKHVSVGYSVTKIVKDEKNPKTGKREITFGFAPHETSIVPVAADIEKAGIGRAFHMSKKARKRNMACDECVGYCYSVEGQLIDLLENCEDQTVCDKVSSGITAVSVAIKGLQYWSEKTSAECVTVCQNTAATLKDVLAAIEASDLDSDDCEGLCDSMTMAIEKLLDNAGGEAAPAVVSETSTRKNEPEKTSSLDNKAFVKSSEQVATPEKTNDMKRILLDKTTDGGGGNTTTVSAPTTEELRKAEMTRIREINATVELLVKDHPTATEKFRKLGGEACDKGTDVRDFKASMISEIPGAKPAKQVTLAELANGDQRAVDNYSIGRAIQSCLLRKSHLPDGIEGGIHEEMVKRGMQPAGAGGFQVPFDATIGRGLTRRQKRDLNVNTFGQGGAFVQTSILTPIIELLRNRMVCDRLGVQGMAGLEGNVAIPRQTGAATAYSLPEQATLAKSTQSLDQIVLTPHRVGAYNSYSRQLLLQSSVDVENFLRDDLMKVIAIKWDYLILQGQGGGSEPTGILNTPGIGSLNFAGTPTWAQVVAFETALSIANADLGNMAYVTSPTVRGRWKAIAKTGIGVTSVVPIFLWEKGAWGDNSNDGEVNAYRAAATNQILNNLVFFGNWEDTIHALWGGYDVIVDPFTQATDGTNRVTVNTFGDVAVRHAASYCVSADSGAQ